MQINLSVFFFLSLLSWMCLSYSKGEKYFPEKDDFFNYKKQIEIVVVNRSRPYLICTTSQTPIKREQDQL